MKLGNLLHGRKLFLSGLIIVTIVSVFWGGSRYPALDDKASMGGATRLEDPLSFEAVLQVQEGDPVSTRVAYSTINWVNTNKQGMIFGVLIAAAILTFIGFLEKRSFKGRASNIISGFLIGSPMGVCVNCAAPIAKGLHSAGARLEMTLTTMFSSPTMNIVVLTMLFTVFPAYLAVIKLATTLIFIFIVLPFMYYFVFPAETQKSAGASNSTYVANNFVNTEENWWRALLTTIKQYAINLWYIFSRTVPLMFVAGFLGALLATLIPFQDFMTEDFTLTGLFIVVLIGTFLPVPIAFDIIVSMALLAAGLPVAYVMALLITLGTYSIYPFMIIWRSISPRVACALYIAVMFTGFLSAVFTYWYEKNEVNSMMDIFIQDAGAAENAGRPNNITITSTDFRLSTSSGNKPFTRVEGHKIGLDMPNTFSVSDYWPPFYYGSGIASGDIHNDGWADILVATKNGPLLFKNLEGKRFEPQKINVPDIHILNTFIPALVDINNDGWLDIFLTSYRRGNYFILNNNGEFNASGFHKTPYNNSVLTLGLSFGDIDKDGDLDAAVGNWYYGWPKEIPTIHARNELYINEKGTFSSKLLDGIIGETLSMLFTDFNHDSHLDLLVANDFDQPDLFYIGDGAGSLKQITRQDGIIPITTHTTMSFDTADIDNNLGFELYIAQIAGRPGQQASRIPSRPLKDYCNDIEDIQSADICRKNIKIREFYRFGSHSPSSIKNCKTLDNKVDAVLCMGMTVMKTAVLGRHPELCEKIPEKLDRARFLCLNYFKPSVKTTQEEYRQSIPQKKNRNVMLVPDGSGKYIDKAEAMGIDIAAWSWNAKFADLDNDEWQDLYVANGILRRDKQPTNFFFHNIKGEKFIEETEDFGLINFMSIPSYTYVDYDRDGDLDIAMNTVNGPLWFYINNSKSNNSITFDLKDHAGNYFGIGSKIQINYGNGERRHQIREIKSGGGYASFDAPTIHFGLGGYKQVDSLEILWSTGERSAIDGPFISGKSYVVTRTSRQ